MLGSIFLTVHLVSAILWVGSVYMGTFFDWPSARESVKEGEFPFRFIVGQGRRIFYSVYMAISFLWITGAGLVMLNPPQDSRTTMMLVAKGICLFLMTAFTMYGTFSTWPKLQLATHAEAHEYYKYYMYRALGTFFCGVIASVLGLWLYL